MSTQVVNTHEAKSRLSELIRAAEQGTEVIVARNGQPVARIVAWEPASQARVAGVWSGQVSYDDDIVGPDDDIAELFSDSSAGGSL